MHKKKWPEGFRKYLETEVQVEYKACLYFFAILFFYCCYLLFQGVYAARILHMAEMIFCTYIVGYVQICLLGNFDEAERFGGKEFLSAAGCTVIYVFVSYLCGWFDKNPAVTAGFAAFLLFGYACLFLVNKIKRGAETKQLNKLLLLYQDKEKKESAKGGVTGRLHQDGKSD